MLWLGLGLSSHFLFLICLICLVFFPLFLFLSCLLLDYFFKIPLMFSVGFLSVYIRVLTYIFSFLLLFFLLMINTFKQYYAILYNLRTLLYSFISLLCAIVIYFTSVYVVNDTTHHYYFCFKYEFFKFIGFKDSSKASLGWSQNTIFVSSDLDMLITHAVLGLILQCSSGLSTLADENSEVFQPCGSPGNCSVTILWKFFAYPWWDFFHTFVALYSARELRNCLCKFLEIILCLPPSSLVLCPADSSCPSLLCLSFYFLCHGLECASRQKVGAIESLLHLFVWSHTSRIIVLCCL